MTAHWYRQDPEDTRGQGHTESSILVDLRIYGLHNLRASQVSFEAMADFFLLYLILNGTAEQSCIKDNTLRRVKDWVQLFCARCLNYLWGRRYHTINRKAVVSM